MRGAIQASPPICSIFRIDILIAETIQADEDLPDDPDQRFAARVLHLDLFKILETCSQDPFQIALLQDGIADLFKRLLIDPVRLSLLLLVRPRLEQLLHDEVHGHNPLPSQSSELRTHDAQVAVEGFILIGRVDRNMLEPLIIQDQAVEPMVLPEPARSVSRRHKKGCSFVIETRILHQFQHIPCGHDAGITLLS